MKTFENVSEVTNKCLMRCAGVVRKDGWQEGAVGMFVHLSGPMFYWEENRSSLPGFYTKEYIERFMEWQEEIYG